MRLFDATLVVKTSSRVSCMHLLGGSALELAAQGSPSMDEALSRACNTKTLCDQDQLSWSKRKSQVKSNLSSKNTRCLRVRRYPTGAQGAATTVVSWSNFKSTAAGCLLLDVPLTPAVPNRTGRIRGGSGFRNKCALVVGMEQPETLRLSLIHLPSREGSPYRLAVS